MYVCMYVCMHVCMFLLFMYVCMYVCMHACMHVCMYARLGPILLFVYLCMYACMYVWCWQCAHVVEPTTALHRFAQATQRRSQPNTHKHEGRTAYFTIQCSTHNTISPYLYVFTILVALHRLRSPEASQIHINTWGDLRIFPYSAPNTRK
jgi:hypothetical protein